MTHWFTFWQNLTLFVNVRVARAVSAGQDPKSVTLVTVGDDGDVDCHAFPTSIAQFERVEVDLTGIEEWRGLVERVAPMLIAWQTVNAVRRPGSPQFTRGFLVVTPGITIRDRLRVLQSNDPDSYYQSRELVPSDMLADLDRAKIVITNYHAFMRRETLSLSKGGRALLTGRGEEIATGMAVRLSAPLLPWPRENAVQLRKQLLSLCHVISFTSQRGRFFVLEPKQCECLVPRLQISRFLQQHPAPAPIAEPHIGGDLIRPIRHTPFAHSGRQSVRWNPHSGCDPPSRLTQRLGPRCVSHNPLFRENERAWCIHHRRVTRTRRRGRSHESTPKFIDCNEPDLLFPYQRFEQPAGQQQLRSEHVTENLVLRTLGITPPRHRRMFGRQPQDNVRDLVAGGEAPPLLAAFSLTQM